MQFSRSIVVSSGVFTGGIGLTQINANCLIRKVTSPEVHHGLRGACDRNPFAAVSRYLAYE